MSDNSTQTKVSLLNVELPEFAETAAKNLTDKPSLSVGQTLSDIWQIVFGNRFSYAAEKQRMKYEHELAEYQKTLEQKVNTIPEEKKIEPSFLIAGQALEDSKYCAESEDLRNLYANLIANSMNIDYVDKVHPSFSKIIHQLSPLDARMLQVFHDHHSHGGIAIVNYIKKTNGDGFENLLEFIPAYMPDCCPPTAAAKSIVSLQRLGLIQIPADVFFSDDGRYARFYNTQLYRELHRKSIMFGYTLDIKKRVARLTPLGEDFVSVCLD